MTLAKAIKRLEELKAWLEQQTDPEFKVEDNKDARAIGVALEAVEKLNKVRAILGKKGGGGW